MIRVYDVKTSLIAIVMNHAVLNGARDDLFCSSDGNHIVFVRCNSGELFRVLIASKFCKKSTVIFDLALGLNSTLQSSSILRYGTPTSVDTDSRNSLPAMPGELIL